LQTLNDLIIKRKADIKASHKSGHAARDNDYTQAIDGWIPIVQAHQKDRNKKSSLQKKKLEANVKHEKRRNRLSQQLKDKPDYEFTSSSSISNSKSSEDQSNSEDSSSDSILSDAEENAEDAEEDAEESKIADLATGASPLNDNAIITGDLNDNEYHTMRVFALEDEDDYLPIASSRPPANKLTLSEPIELQRSKTAKQSRKPTACAKFAGDKKTSKRSKQTRISVADNISLGILQQTLSDYFKGQMQSTEDTSRQQSLLKKIEDML